MIVFFLLATLTAAVGEQTRAGDAIIVRGERVFPRGSQLSFFVGGTYAPSRVVDANSVWVVVPVVPEGAQPLTYVRARTSDATGAEEIARLKVVVTREESLPAGDMIAITSKAIAEGATVTVQRQRSDSERFIIRSQLLQEHTLPPFSFDDAFVISATGAAELSEVRVNVPQEWLDTVPTGFRPEVYYYYEDRGANDEVISYVAPLRAEWDAATRQLHALLSPARKLAPDQPLTLYLAVRSNQ
jgi:hypothetical protein